MTRRNAPYSSENPRPVSILRLQTDGLGRLCESLETAGFLSGAPHTAGNPAKKAYLLDGLQHPKADKLIIYSPEEGPQLDLNVFKVKELRSLAACLQIPLKSTDNKADIVLKISDNVAGNVLVWAVTAGHSSQKYQNHMTASRSDLVSNVFHAHDYRYRVS